MVVASSYAVGIEKAGRKTFGETEQIYRAAVSFLIDVFDREWSELSAVSGRRDLSHAAERLVHTTKKNSAQYNFDAKFPKMPSYLRRAAIEAALGAVSSYRSNLENWKAGRRKGKPPKLTCDRMVMPVFYNDQMYRPGDEPDTAYLKLHHHGDWVWTKVRLKHTDVRYLEKYWSHETASAPTLERHHGKYQLRFAFTENIRLTKKQPEDQIVCAVDLGLNTDAVCVIMDSQGTVAERKFIDFPAEKDLVWTVYGRTRRHMRNHGPRSVKSLWRYARCLNDEHAKMVGTAIADFAYAAGADVIVFEYLDFRGRKRGGSKAQKLSQWRRNTIQEIAAHRAHRLGLRVSHICAWNTSRLAYDGSGRLERDKHNKALATFSNGKQYNADLNAAYNIGARYFVRELQKPLPATERSRLAAEVPDAGRRTCAVLQTLWLLRKAMAKPAA